MSNPLPERREHGMSLIEVAVFIVVVGIALAGIVALYSQLTRASVDPMVRKQALAIASSLLEEIELRAFTFCDPDDAAVYTAANSGGCTTPEIVGTEGGETRYGPTSFDNVSDYHNFKMGTGQVDPNIRTLDNTVLPGLSSYSVEVSITTIAQDELPTFKTTPGAGESPLADA